MEIEIFSDSYILREISFGKLCMWKLRTCNLTKVLMELMQQISLLGVSKTILNRYKLQIHNFSWNQ